MTAALGGYEIDLPSQHADRRAKVHDPLGPVWLFCQQSSQPNPLGRLLRAGSAQSTAQAERSDTLQVRFLFERPSAWELVRRLEPAAGPGVGSVSCSAPSTQAPEQHQQQAPAGRPLQLTFSRRSQVRDAATGQRMWVCMFVNLVCKTLPARHSLKHGMCREYPTLPLEATDAPYHPIPAAAALRFETISLTRAL